ncbi:sensor histidine kinase [Halorientalis pallida]|uniref:histidine kinase n=1 Tax=Halorientalis pallida TaxID=2479928 RepID=A0A498KWQ7_9EURY|nr:histidine kinase N-terminal 7TM domain-containing protein [Halorientalis pallida]RXK49275.1 PAS domain-containing protein [Halorientalis pallida]
MVWWLSPHAVLTVLSTVLGVGVTVFSLRNRRVAGAVPLAALMGAASLWSALDLVAVPVSGIEGKLVLSRLQMSLAPLAVLCWLWFAVVYTGHEEWVNRRSVPALLAEPAAFTAAIWVLDPAPLLRSNPTLEAAGGQQVLRYDPGPLFEAHIAYTYLLFLTGAILLTRLVVNTERLYRDQSVALLLAVCGPLAANALWLLGLLPAGVETNVGFVFTGVVLAVAIFRQRLLEIVPIAKEIAREELITEMEDRVFVLDADDRIVDANPSARRLVGRGSIVGEPLSSVLPELDAELREGDTEEPGSVRIAVDGIERDFDVRVARLRRAHGLVAGRLVSLRDVTSQRRREQRLNVLMRVLRHNLRNGTAGVIGYAQVISQQADDTEVATAADRILAQSWELSDLSDQAREIATVLEHGDETRTVHDLPTVVTDAVGEVTEEYPEVDAETAVPEDASALAVESFPTAVSQLVENACEHNDDENPWLRVTVDTYERDGHGWVRLLVVDNGPGIPEADVTALEQGYETALEHGSGLGLWIVKWIAELSGGTVSFPETDHGGAVAVSLPRTEQSRADDGRASVGPESNGQQSGKN